MKQAFLLLAGSAALASCSASGRGGEGLETAANASPANGPQADYPLVVGEPYAVDGTSYTPADVLNYDQVGYLAGGTGAGIMGAHHTLPFPSYVEVTSLETGRTILARIEARGPMDTTHLLALSPAAMEQLGASAETPVRVRRVNPPEEQRRLLREDLPVPLRMDTPMQLVEVLRRRLPEVGSASLRVGVPAPADPVSETVAEAFAEVTAEPAEVAEAAPKPAQAPAPEITAGFVVQAAAFSSAANADRAAAALGGTVSQSGRFYRVRTGPFATRDEAEASLANVQAAGYSDARIYSTG
ncbi:sporulation protein SsgA [Alteraurantiacibacter aquimixticola]|uniref:Sporulation protein SsgA n=1 Tax=Alteraurantiacibacter aquimixticola TaxID=2489173 RepID=A0A4T3F7A9_9SPHN|nr:sporulation protein SsgA [Alteraurantiacibacter aquimixticola]